MNQGIPQNLEPESLDDGLFARWTKGVISLVSGEVPCVDIFEARF